MLYRNLIDQLIERVKLDKTKASDRELAGKKINLAYKEIANNSSADWEYLKRYGEIQSVANISTGTVTITNGSRTVTGSNTSFDSTMVGRFFQPQGSVNWYRIGYVQSTSVLILDTPIIEASGSAKTYTIWKRFYYFPGEVRKVIEMGSWIRDGILVEKSINSIRDNNPDISNTGEPREFFLYGADPLESIYTTGSVSLTANSNTMTGAGTAWLANVEKGDRVEVGTQVFHVRSVELDTQIKLSNYSPNAQSGSAYRIVKEHNIGFQMWFNPNSAYLFPYTYIKRVYDLVNEDYDYPELPDEFDAAILDGAEARFLADKNDERWINIQALYSARIKDLRSNRLLSSPRFRQMRPRITSRGAYI